MERLSVQQFVRWVALFSMSCLPLSLSCAIWWSGDFTLSQADRRPRLEPPSCNLPWIPRFGISFHLAVDGLSLLMVMLTCFLGVHGGPLLLEAR
jgi:NADH-quinone oxidoreductase subunit M